MQWVRSHPFTITAPVLTASTFDLETYTGAGIEHPADVGERGKRRQGGRRKPESLDPALGKPPEPRERNFEQMVPLERERAVKYMNTYPGCIGFIMWDEVKGANLEHAGDEVKWTKQTFPHLLAYINVHAMEPEANYWIRVKENATAPPAPQPYGYDEFLKDVVTRTGTDVLSVDPYPCVDPEEYPFYGDVPKLLKTTYYYTLGTAHKAAMDAGIPYWRFVQAFGIPSAYYLPSESDLRMQIYTSLAYGFTGIQYFIYQAPTGPGYWMPMENRARFTRRSWM